MTSRESDVTMGVIMTARMRPAVMKEAPLVGDPNRASSTGMPVMPEAMAL